MQDAGEGAQVHPELEVLRHLAEDGHRVRHRLEADGTAAGEVRRRGDVLVGDGRDHRDAVVIRPEPALALGQVHLHPALERRASRGRRPGCGRGGRSRGPSRRRSAGSGRGRARPRCGGSRSGRGARCRRGASRRRGRRGRGRRAGTARGRTRDAGRTRPAGRPSSSRGRARGCPRSSRGAARPASPRGGRRGRGRGPRTCGRGSGAPPAAFQWSTTGPSAPGAPSLTCVKPVSRSPTWRTCAPAGTLTRTRPPRRAPGASSCPGAKSVPPFGTRRRKARRGGTVTSSRSFLPEAASSASGASNVVGPLTSFFTSRTRFVCSAGSRKRPPNGQPEPTMMSAVIPRSRAPSAAAFTAAHHSGLSQGRSGKAARPSFGTSSRIAIVLISTPPTPAAFSTSSWRRISASVTREPFHHHRTKGRSRAGGCWNDSKSGSGAAAGPANARGTRERERTAAARIERMAASLGPFAAAGQRRPTRSNACGRGRCGGCPSAARRPGRRAARRPRRRTAG